MMFADFLALIYPRHCLACERPLYRHERHVCTHCYVGLPRSYFHLQEHNPMERLFYGRAPVVAAAGYYLFRKEGGIQKLLHSIKYKGNKELAQNIGEWFGQELSQSSRFTGIDAIIPVPLHQKKLKQRGYNQSELFARGLAASMHVVLDTQSLQRRTYTSSQTRKNKFERWENVEDTFELSNPQALAGKHVLLVDDVITTGATIEACCAELLKVPGLRISLASMAFATTS